MTQDYQFRDEWLIKRDVIQKSDIVCFDTDANGSSEVIFFTQSKDSVFLNLLDPFGKLNQGIHSVFIDLIAPDRGTYDVIFKGIDFSDINNDGMFEFTFGIAAGYCRQPRKIYRYHFSDGKFETSENTAIGINFSYPVTVYDLDGDFKNEFLISTSDFKNYSEIIDETRFTQLDTCSWILAYDDDLTFLFEPISINNINFLAGEICIDNHNYFYYAEKDKDGIHQQVFIRNAKGVIIKQFPLPLSIGTTISAIPALNTVRKDRMYITDGLSVFVYSTEGKLVDEFAFGNGFSPSEIYAMDIIGDKSPEYIFNTTEGLWITDSKLQFPLLLPLPEAIWLPYHLTVMSKKHGSVILSLNNYAYDYEISYTHNPAYFWRHPVWFGVYMAVVLLLWLTQVLQKRQLRQKFEAERELMSFRFRALKNQVDPHFTLNALNSIAHMQEHGQQEKAGRFLVKFSRMIHRTLENSDKIETSLEDELSFVRDYLDVQQMRFREAFSYEISMDDDELNDLLVPRHLIHTFVENALKHGIRPLDKGGLISIVLKRGQEHVTITISDNGIGRAEASKYKHLSTGKGLKIINELIELFERLRKVKISYQIEDIYSDSGKASGTLVTIRIPITYEP